MRSIVLLSALLACRAACAQSDADVESLAKQLSDDAYEVRREAYEKLKSLGGPALPALRQAARSNDVELRRQAERLIVVIEQSSYERRLAAFLEHREDVDLPGWKAFRCACQADDESRAMFVALLRAEPELWRLAGGGDRPRLDREFEQRCRAIEATNDYRRRRTAPWPTVCTLLLLAADEQARLQYQSSFTLYNLASHSALDEPLSIEVRAGKVKLLMAAWIERGDKSAAILRFQLAYRHQLPACLAPALELLQDNRESYVHHKAMLIVAAHGKREHLDVVSRYLDDKTILYKRGDTGYTCQSRDAALSAILHLSGRDPADFGFEQLKPDPFHLHQYNSIGFGSDEQRTAAFAKWRAADQAR